jgi:hypothetical protein
MGVLIQLGHTWEVGMRTFVIALAAVVGRLFSFHLAAP